MNALECAILYVFLAQFLALGRGKHEYYVRAVWWVKEAPGCWNYDVGFSISCCFPFYLFGGFVL